MAVRRRPRRAAPPRRLPFYVYALLDAPVVLPRVTGARLEIVEAGEFFVAGERRRRPALSERALRRQHDIVTRIGRAADAVLPVRFGTVVSPSELEALLAPRTRVLRRAFRAVRGRVQMTTRWYGPSPARATVLPPTSGRDYLRARAAAARPVLPPAADAVRAAVRSLADAERIDPGRGDVQVSVHHLVRRERLTRYLERLEVALARCTPAPTLSLSGPWPPFAFTPDLWDVD
ncbi:MAG TPA: GvpL/GvpF family gas vesicle protein [Vicinamibacterales bacterium]|nr:GvpL/GvpF family gas vesicle protein [Vicinamibacterales bacterium]